MVFILYLSHFEGCLQPGTLTTSYAGCFVAQQPAKALLLLMNMPSSLSLFFNLLSFTNFLEFPSKLFLKTYFRSHSVHETLMLSSSKLILSSSYFSLFLLN